MSVVLLDWKMPRMDGIECARHLMAGALPMASLGTLAVQRSAGALERACAEHAADEGVTLRPAQVEIDLAPLIKGLAELPR